MGVSGLLNLLKSIQKPTHLRHFAGQTLGVDAYGWLHRGAVHCAADLALGKPSTKYVDFAMHRVRMLVHFGVTPYLVFDGDRLPSKAGTEQERADRRKESKNAALELLRLGKSAQAHQEFQKAVDITPEMAGLLMEELKRNNIQYVVAPYEADAQMVYLERKGIINGIVSEDSDLLVFGAKTLLTKLDQYGECVMIREIDYTACREVNLNGWKIDQFRCMAILSGCDYLQGIPRMGLKTAYRLVRKCHTIERTLQVAQLEGKFRIPVDYLDRFQQAERTFLYQWVYCPISKKLVNLTPPFSTEQLEGLTYIGEYVEPAIAQRVANGQLNPMTKLPIVIEWPRGSKPQPHIPARAEKENAVQSKNKTIDSFFTSCNKREPLAELDPNSLLLTKSQEQLLDQNRSQVWTPVEAPRRSTLAPQSQTISASTVTPCGNSIRGLQARKRQRLCTEDESLSTNALFNAHDERSKFFTGTKSNTPVVSAKKSKLPEINIWSDDSIDDAMAALPDIESSVSKSQQFARAQAKHGRFEVFKDNTVSEFHEKAPALDLESFERSEENHSETTFTSGLLAQTQALRNSSSSKTNVKANHSGHPPTTETEPFTNPDGPVPPMTPPSSHRVAENLNKSQMDSTANYLATIEETPLNKHSVPHENNESPSTSRCAPPISPKLLETKVIETTQGVDLQPTPTPPKGTEDLFIVPDSDAETGSSEYGASAPSSPTRRRMQTLEYEQQTEDQEEDEAENATPRPVTRLNLSRFAFGAVGSLAT